LIISNHSRKMKEKASKLRCRLPCFGMTDSLPSADNLKRVTTKSPMKHKPKKTFTRLHRGDVSTIVKAHTEERPTSFNSTSDAADINAQQQREKPSSGFDRGGRN
jgi:hypothetical protein